MPVYAYKGVTAGNQNTRGTLEAESSRAARARLRSEGIFPTEIGEARTRSASSDLLSRLQLPELRRVSDLDLVLFSNQLATLLGAGVPLVESLSALTEQIESERLKAIVGRVRDSVNEGTSLADALEQYPRVFDGLYTSMVQAGESSGALELVLQRLGNYIEKRMQLRNKVISAMTYPLLMLGASAIVSGVLLVFVIPNITQLLIDMNQPLPLLTVIVISVSEFLVDWWTVLAISAGALFLLVHRLIQLPRGREIWDRFRLRIPVMGRTVRYIALSRFSQTLSTLLAGGVSIVRALDIAKSIAGNAVIAAAVEQARDAITRGTSIAGPLRQSGEFPPMVTHMISVGEASGELAEMLTKVAETYDELVENSLNRLTTLMGPLLLLLVATVVVLIVLSTLLPLMNLTSAL